MARVIISTSPSAKGVVRVELPTSQYAPLLLLALAHFAAVIKPDAMYAGGRTLAHYFSQHKSLVRPAGRSSSYSIAESYRLSPAARRDFSSRHGLMIFFHAPHNGRDDLTDISILCSKQRCNIGTSATLFELHYIDGKVKEPRIVRMRTLLSA
jgi:hypothetical protein